MTVYCPFSNSWLEFFVFLLFLPSHFPFEHKNDTVSFEMPLLFVVPEHYLLGPFVFGLLSKTKNCDFLERNSYIFLWINIYNKLPNVCSILLYYKPWEEIAPNYNSHWLSRMKRAKMANLFAYPVSGSKTIGWSTIFVLNFGTSFFVYCQ